MTRHSRYTGVSVSPEMANRFQDLASDDDVEALDWLWKEVCPTMAKRRRARTAVLLLLASEADRNGQRGRIHVLLHGPGGTGKTVLKDWTKYNLPDAVGCGPDSSGAGLRFNGNTGETGKLVAAHEGTLCIEEFDKFEKEDRNACYEAMSEGYFEVAKGGVDQEFPAECRTLAVGNDTSTFAGPLMSRFDFVIEVEDYGEDETVEVGTRLYDLFADSFVRDDPPEEDNVLQQYLSWVEPFRPSITGETAGTIKDYLERLVRETGDTGDIRGKEAYLRVAYTIAKLNMEDIAPKHWVQAVELIHPERDVAALFPDMTDSLLGIEAGA